MGITDRWCQTLTQQCLDVVVRSLVVGGRVNDSKRVASIGHLRFDTSGSEVMDQQ